MMQRGRWVAVVGIALLLGALLVSRGGTFLRWITDATAYTFDDYADESAPLNIAYYTGTREVASEALDAHLALLDDLERSGFAGVDFVLARSALFVRKAMIAEANGRVPESEAWLERAVELHRDAGRTVTAEELRAARTEFDQGMGTVWLLEWLGEAEE